MPHFNFKNVDIDVVRDLSISKTHELADTFGCPVLDITYDVFNSTSIVDGEIIDGDKTIIVQMFEREQEIKDEIVQILEEYLGETTIIFQIIEPYNYYEYGKNFS